MSLYPFPDVPDSPGVPALPRSPLFPPAASAGLGLVEGLIWRILQVQNQWGIFTAEGQTLGNPSQFLNIPGDILQSVGLGATLSTNSVDYSKDMRVSDFPVERGGFASYNKVEMPANPSVVLCFDGSESERTAFLDQIDAATKSTDLYNVVTPEITYVGYTLESYRYERRASRGASLLMVEIRLLEVREISVTFASTINDPKNPGATPQADTGVVQPQTPPTSVAKSLSVTISNAVTGAITPLVQ